ncbi:hypothetical protein GQ55_5G343400 [Panicum hallii var. hallii]|uniref:DUF1409 domain-containing protein n=1 Tax=Panicum hallii var. hallii TaxID=1504633 RepID=A0A2T7DM54_9POAL|nr:hypothetical protein GQ55_5G343400 [Panicum hallii var. hallii]
MPTFRAADRSTVMLSRYRFACGGPVPRIRTLSPAPKRLRTSMQALVGSSSQPISSHDPSDDGTAAPQPMLTLLPPSGNSNFDEISLKQDSPDNNIFSFAIGITPSEEDQPSAESAGLADDLKSKLLEILPLLSQDIGQLVRDVEPIRAALRSLEGQLPEPIEGALTPAAFIKSHRMRVLRAQKRLANRIQQEQIAKQRDELNGHELQQVNQEIDVADSDLSQIQPTVEKLKSEKQDQASQAYQLHKSILPIPGSADGDNRAIQEADDIRLHTINVIRNSLGLL